MEPKIADYFAKAKEMSDRGDGYAKQKNYQFALKCYLNVVSALSHITKQTNKIDAVEKLQHKIQKYKNLVEEMDLKNRQSKKMSNKANISKLGFPVQPKNAVTVPVVKNTVQMKQPEPKIVKQEKKNEIQGLRVVKTSFDDIAGMKDVKQILYEAVIVPQKRPDLFEGIRSPPRGILLYGPPGNGKTLITKALAKESGCAFFGISAGSIVNKFVGESQKTLRSIFETAKTNSPSIIFIDEIDSILTSRSQNDSDASRRLKTQFLVQFDNLEGPVIIIGATNLPSELDLAALRRFNKLVYIGLPDKQARLGIIQRNLKQVPYNLSKSDEDKLLAKLDGYSASEITDIIKEASMAPIREIPQQMLTTIKKKQIRPINYQDFTQVISHKKPLLAKADLQKYKGKFI